MLLPSSESAAIRAGEPRSFLLHKIDTIAHSTQFHHVTTTTMSSNLWNNITGQHEEGEGFSLFPNLPPELRALIWRHTTEPRLIFILPGVPRAGPLTRFHRVVMNRAHLVETNQPLSVLCACHESRHEALTGAQRDLSSLNWLSILGILEFNPTAADLVYFGGLRDQGQTPPADTDTIIPFCLVLGNILPRVCTNGDVFASYFDRDDETEEGQPPENPIEKGLASLRALNAQFAPLFADTPAGLPSPRLPESMVFMLDNLPLRWAITSPCTNPAHNRVFILSCCMHYDHLEIIPDADMDAWMDANLEQYDEDKARRIRTETVPSIRAIWAGWRSRSDIAAQVPQMFFARIRPSGELANRAGDQVASGSSKSQEPEA